MRTVDPTAPMEPRTRQTETTVAALGFSAILIHCVTSSVTEMSPWLSPLHMQPLHHRVASRPALCFAPTASLHIDDKPCPDTEGHPEPGRRPPRCHRPSSIARSNESPSPTSLRSASPSTASSGRRPGQPTTPRRCIAAPRPLR
jgi:hypothetical protein